MLSPLIYHSKKVIDPSTYKHIHEKLGKYYNHLLHKYSNKKIIYLLLILIIIVLTIKKIIYKIKKLLSHKKEKHSESEDVDECTDEDDKDYSCKSSYIGSSFCSSECDE